MKTFIDIIHVIGYFTTIWFIYVAYTTSDQTIYCISQWWRQLKGRYWKKYKYHCIMCGKTIRTNMFMSDPTSLSCWPTDCRKKKSFADKLILIGKVLFFIGIIMILAGLIVATGLTST